MQVCNTCKLNKPLEDFQHDITRSLGRTYKCKQCLSKYNSFKKDQNKARRRRHYLKAGEYYRRKKLMREHGVTKEQYDLIAKQQNYLCKICDLPESLKHARTGTPISLSVDHCHETGIIRGLLCGRCNMALGAFKDKHELLNKAINYLKGA